MFARITHRIRSWLALLSGNRQATAADVQAAADLERLRQEHEHTRAEAHREVGEVLSCTEEATLSVCGSLDRVVNEAQAFIGDIKSRLGALEQQGGGGVSATLDRQCKLVTGFLAELREAVQLQRDAANRMLATSHKVSQAASSVSQISTATRVLCLNTMIEAGRLGDVGQPMIVIADQMRTLSEQIGNSNKEISEHMAALLPTLEDVGKSSAQVDARAASFSGEFDVQASEVGAIAQQLRDTVEAALGNGDEKLDTILGSSRSALESLQTQDLVSQRLRRVLQVLDRSGAQHSDQASSSSKQVDGNQPNVYLSESMGGEEKRELEAGEMMLF